MKISGLGQTRPEGPKPEAVQADRGDVFFLGKGSQRFLAFYRRLYNGFFTFQKLLAMLQPRCIFC